ncbi:hypothetical protein CICLE_v10003636mg [Citrus x clementina]|uniref:Uncharacterized protein n=3 Tax=Citrus TaxID=2706 RepID=A0ACB8KG41_CITSI|nr:hypothetical protein CICLE_v10003636mg [Citrus x clementina]KAH9753338.1 hypothetical protein KPL71_015036 [Citrus sinensis]KDO42179.1 hypothetical protein CISIN_1g048628mg [Citrus sinensis]
MPTCSYHIFASTQFFINACQLQRDPRIREEQCKVQPETFLTRHKDIDVRGQHFELLSRGGGGMCSGVSFCPPSFDFATPSNKPLDMGEGLGLTVEKFAPLEVLQN